MFYNYFNLNKYAQVVMSPPQTTPTTTPVDNNQVVQPQAVQPQVLQPQADPIPNRTELRNEVTVAIQTIRKVVAQLGNYETQEQQRIQFGEVNVKLNQIQQILLGL